MCDAEDQFTNLPKHIQKECIDKFGYVPGTYSKTSKLLSKKFPIKTATACQLKWNWSTVYLPMETTASCHRTNLHKFDTKTFNFHNTPTKVNDRKRMLEGQWPEVGCDYCKDIEASGGQSDRITNLDFPGMHAPRELEDNPNAVNVTPRILEVYFDNTCNLKCLYCGPHFSSLWAGDISQHGEFRQDGVKIAQFVKSSNIDQNKQKLFDWLKNNAQHLTSFNVLGGEPLYQDELDQCLDLFEQFPAPELTFQFFTNLNTKLSHLQRVINRVKDLIDKKCIRELEITASLDCWGAEQEYVRYPLKLDVWEKNFEFLVNQPWIRLIVSSTITPLTIKTLPDLLEKLNTWRQLRPIYHYQNSVNNVEYMYIDIFGDAFRADFDKAISLKPEGTPEEIQSKRYLEGIAQQASKQLPKVEEIKNLYIYLNEIDRRRGTSWPTTFPWLVNEFKKFNLGE